MYSKGQEVVSGDGSATPNFSPSFSLYIFLIMRLDIILRGMLAPRKLPISRTNNMSKHLKDDQKALFIIQHLVGEIVRLNKLIARQKGRDIKIFSHY